MAVNGTVSISVTGSQTSALDLGTVTFPYTTSFGAAYGSGTGAGQIDRVYTKTRTLSASATEDLDLASGALLDALTGTAITFARIKAVYFKAAVANTNNVNITRPASNGVPDFIAAGDGIALRPGAAWSWASDLTDATGVVVTAGTGDLITVTNSGGTTGVTYTVVILGCSA